MSKRKEEDAQIDISSTSLDDLQNKVLNKNKTENIPEPEPPQDVQESNVNNKSKIAFLQEKDTLAIEIKEIMDSLNLTTTENNIIQNYFKRVSIDPYILHIIPLCSDKTCIFSELNCPFVKFQKIPIGKPCPIAMHLAMSLREQWLQAISSRLQPQTPDNKDEYNSIEYDIVIYRLIVSLVEVDLRDIMLDKEISKNGLIDEKASCQVSRTGEVFWMPGESIASIIHEKIQARRDTILKQLLLTPEISAKYKLLKDTDNDKDKDLDSLKDRVLKRNKEILLETESLNKNKGEYGTNNNYKTLYDRLQQEENSEE